MNKNRDSPSANIDCYDTPHRLLREYSHSSPSAFAFKRILCAFVEALSLGVQPSAHSINPKEIQARWTETIGDEQLLVSVAIHSSSNVEDHRGRELVFGAKHTVHCARLGRQNGSGVHRHFHPQLLTALLMSLLPSPWHQSMMSVSMHVSVSC